jgi:prepilin-type N-terminal cleavage/methylation domain-containing protein
MLLRPAFARRGLTLVELLVALVISLLIAGVVFSTYRMVSVVASGQQARRQGSHAAAAALEQLRLDLFTAFLPAGDAACALTLQKPADEQGSSALSFCLVQRPAAPADPAFAEIWSIGYSLAGERGLIRSSRPAVGPASIQPAATNQLMGKATAFRVQLFDGISWREQWPAEEEQGKPQRARIELAAGDSRWEAEFLIPAGLVITSSIQRSAQPAGT